MARRKRKIKKYYTISVTSDYSAKKSKVYRCRFNFIKAGILCSLLILVIAMGLTYYWYTNLSGMEEKVSTLKTLVAEQEDTIVRLGNENADLESENEILADLLSKAEDEILKAKTEDEEQHVPTLFPIKGSVLVADIRDVSDLYFAELGDITEDTKNQTEAVIAEEYNSVLVFKANQSSDMVASGAGIVTSVGEDNLFGAYVVVDHGNGYETVYRNNGDMKVDVGDELVCGQLIFVNTEDGNYFGFQIAADGNYVDPLTIISTNG